MSSVMSELAALRDWWIHEMRELLADALARIAPKRAIVTKIAVSADGGCDAPDVKGNGARAQIVLPDSAVLIRELTLPAAAEHDLASIVELQLERDLPVSRESVVVAWRVIEKGRPDGRLRVRIAVALKEQVEMLRERVAGWGFRPAYVGLEGGDALNFLKPGVGKLAVRFTRADGYLAAAAAVLVLIFLGVVGGQWVHERTVVGRELNASRDRVLTIDRMRQALVTRLKPIDEIQQQAHGVSVDQALVGLTEAVPVDSWLQQLELNASGEGDATVKLVALTPAATTLVAGLARDARLRDVQLLSAIPAAGGNNRDRAEISARWRR